MMKDIHDCKDNVQIAKESLQFLSKVKSDIDNKNTKG